MAVSVACTLLITSENLCYFKAETLNELYEQLKQALPATFLTLHGEPKGDVPDHIHGLTALRFKNKKKPFFKGHLSPLLRDQTTFDAVYWDLLGTLAGEQGVVQHMPGLCCPSQFVLLARDFDKPKQALGLYDLIVDEDSKSMHFEPTDCIKVKKFLKVYKFFKFYKF